MHNVTSEKKIVLKLISGDFTCVDIRKYVQPVEYGLLVFFKSAIIVGKLSKICLKQNGRRQHHSEITDTFFCVVKSNRRKWLRDSMNTVNNVLSTAVSSYY